MQTLTNKSKLSEHKRNTTNGEIVKSKIAEHSWEQKHRFQWDKASIISKAQNYKPVFPISSGAPCVLAS